MSRAIVERIATNTRLNDDLPKTMGVVLRSRIFPPSDAAHFVLLNLPKYSVASLAAIRIVASAAMQTTRSPVKPNL
jgi:hypothetical protein